MYQRLARTVAILVVIGVLGGVVLTDRARRLERQRARAAARDSAAGIATATNPDSVRIATAAVAAYDADRRARGAAPLAVDVLAYEPTRGGVRVTLLPRELVVGGDAVVWVGSDGEARIESRGP
jgi:hypothetical protein